MPADDLIRIVNTNADDTAERLADLKVQIEEKIRGLLAKLKAEDGRFVSTKEAIADAQKIRAQILTVMRKEGLPVILSMIDESAAQTAADVIAQMDKDLKDPPPGFEADVGPELDRIVKQARREISSEWKDYEQEVRRAIDRSVIGKRALLTSVDEISGKAGISVGQATVMVDAAVRGVGSEAIIRQTIRAADENGSDMGFLYSGPRGGSIRDFCSFYVGKVVTAAAIGDLDSDPRLDANQPRPVSTYRGGYRCRHLWLPIRLQDARKRGLTIIGDA